MGFRFRKIIKIAPGIRLNLSKSGVSASFGKQGASVNVGAKGTYVNIGAPGTGLSFRGKLPESNPSRLSLKRSGNTFDIQDNEISPEENVPPMTKEDIALGLVGMILYVGVLLGILYGLWRLLVGLIL